MSAEKVEMDDFFKATQSLREKVASLRTNITEKLMEHKKAAGNSAPITEKGEVVGLLKRNIVDMMDLRIKHRSIQMVDLTKGMKGELMKKKEGVDERNVSLQSLVYQKNNLFREITDCKAFQTTELFRISSYPGLDPSDKANYDQILTWLKGELNVFFDRQALDKKYKEISAEKTQAEKELEELQIQYERYPQLLQKLEEAAGPLQAAFGIYSEEIAMKLQEAKVLPGPLYTIYMKFEGYKQEANDDSIEVKIVGDYQKAEAVTTGKASHFSALRRHRKLQEEAEGKKAGEISESSKKIKKKKQRRSVKRDRKEDLVMPTLFVPEVNFYTGSTGSEDMLQKYPLSVQLTLKKGLSLHLPKEAQSYMNDTYPVDLYFFLYPKLGLVTCSARSKDSKLSSLQILHSLFAEDDGHYAIDYLKRGNVMWNSEDERPYSWVHFLAGIYDFAFFNTSPQNGSSEAYFYDPGSVNVEAVLNKLHNRVASVTALQYQMEFLSKNHRIAPEVMQTLSSQQQFKLIKDKTVIREFNPITREFFIAGASSQMPELLQSRSGIMGGLQKGPAGVPMKIPVFVRAEDGTYIKTYQENTSPCKHEAGYYYNILLERSGFNIRGFIEIGHNYPSSVPNIVLRMESVKKAEEERSELAELEGNDFGYSHVLREIEQELTVYWPEYCSEHEKLYLISHQIKKLTTCVEILVDTENDKATTLYQKGKKGVFRSRPFAYNPATNMYEQR